MTNEEKLLNFRITTMEAARKQSADILEAYTKSLEEAFEEHRARKEQQAELILKAEKDNLKRRKNKELSLDQIQVRHEVTNKREELKTKLFTGVKDLLANYMETPAYEELLRKQIRKDVMFAKREEVIIYIDPADQGLKHSLEAATGVALTVSEYSFGGGTRAVLPKRNILIDDSFVTKIEEEYQKFSFKGGRLYE